MRGKHHLSLHPNDLTWSIPAHAGETKTIIISALQTMVNPRSCGGNERNENPTCLDLGQSPLMRGKPKPLSPLGSPRRSIPAHAGETFMRLPGSEKTEVNPRSCGGNRSLEACRKGGRGQSPLMRGKRAPRISAIDSLGSIPAHAGETICQTKLGIFLAVNPRSCGGNSGSGSEPSGDRGQSPLMRGKPEAPKTKTTKRRSIPAHAGETLEEAGEFWSFEVNPRSCGGNSLIFTVRFDVKGQSPLMRGKHRGARDGDLALRSIPAHAGETSDFEGPTCLSRVNPRSCGGNGSGAPEHWA